MSETTYPRGSGNEDAMSTTAVAQADGDAGTWTEHWRRCESCGRAFRIDSVALEIAREDAAQYGEPAADVLDGFTGCLRCEFGEVVPGEYQVGEAMQLGGNCGGDLDHEGRPVVDGAWYRVLNDEVIDGPFPTEAEANGVFA